MCIVGMLFCWKYLSKRTKYGQEMLIRINSFKNFIETTDRNKLKSLMTQNSMYFYDVLPYAYSLGISDKLINKFKSLFA